MGGTLEMTATPSQEDLRQMASRWLLPSHAAHHFQIHTDTTDFFRVEYGDVVVLDGSPYLIRVLNFIKGQSLYDYVEGLGLDHQTYFIDRLPVILNNFIECIEAVRFLHEYGEKHGDIRRDHILIDRQSRARLHGVGSRITPNFF
jgi:hypothetical protein